MVIIVRGACSVGKTTVSRALVQLMPHSAHVDCGETMPWMSDATLEELRSRGEQTIPDILNAWLVATSLTFDAQGIHTVVDWHFPADAELRNLCCKLDRCALSYSIYNLRCSPDEHLRRDRGRNSDAQIGERGIEYFRTKGSSVNSPVGVDIDTTAMTPDVIAKHIMEHTKANKSMDCTSQ